MNTPENIRSREMDFIRVNHPFDLLNEEELELVSKSYEITEYSPGTHILSQGGDQSHHLYLIRKGAVRVVRDGQVLQVLEEGEVFGYPSMINEESPFSDVIAEEKVLVYRIFETVFHQLIDNAEFAEFFLKNLGHRLRDLFTRDTTSISGGLTTPVESLVVRSPVMVSPAATVAEAAQMMRKAWVEAALVMEQPPGIVTDSDFLVKVLAEELGPETSVRRVMTRPIKTISAETPVYSALLFMLEENIHHLPITREGKIIGIVSSSDLLRFQARNPLYLMQQLEHLEAPETLARYSMEVAATVESLFNGGLDVAQIGRVVASLNDALIRRLLRVAEEELGPPPTPYAWLVFGSEGRMEQAILTDQDNALVYLEDSPEARDYFQKLAEQVVNNLVKAGFPPCPGGYMATNWCRPRSEWVKQFKKWVETPNPQALLEIAIFFDFRSVHGELSIEPLEEVIMSSKNQSIFLAHLAHAALEFQPPLGFFRRIRSEDGKVNLKSGGVVPVVSMARVYAIAAGLRVRSTVDRLQGAMEAGNLSRTGAETLIETYRFLLQLRLREQLAAIADGTKPTNKIRLQALSSVEKRHLKDAFMAIREMQEATSQHFHTTRM